MPKTKTGTTSILLPPDLDEEVRLYAFTNKLKLREVFVAALEMYMAQRRGNTLRP